MEDILNIALLMLFLVNVVFGLLLGYTFVFRPSHFFKNVFPKNKPKVDFFSKNTADSDFLVLYYGFRFFILCFSVTFFVLVIR